VTKFYIVDQSLVNRGGHHYDYTMCVAEAANTMGFETIILANKSLDVKTTFPNTQLHRTFKNTVYQRDSYLAGLRHLKRSKVDLTRRSAPTGSYWNQLKSICHLRKLKQRRGKIINQFAMDCQNAFAGVSFDESDHIFLTTVSELEMMGLAIYLRSNHTTIAPTWHLQFHFNLFEGRTPEYASQSLIESMTRECFESTFNRLSYHRLRCYTTSQTLADQYNRLGVGNLTSLPYPVAPEFAIASDALHSNASNRKNQQPHFADHQRNVATQQQARTATAGRKDVPTSARQHSIELDVTAAPVPSSMDASVRQKALRFTCPGQIRREKGCFEYLQPLVNELWDSHLTSGKIKIALQRPRRKKLRKQKIELTLPHHNDNSALSNDAIEYFDHPLGRTAYIDFIKNTDCGLLFYDSRTYYSRRAGVLGELLSAGKPLIVSAGSWLAQQIAEPNFQHGEDLLGQADAKRVLRIEDVEYGDKNVPSAGGVITFDRGKHPFHFSLNRQAQEQLLLFRFQWKFPTEDGTFVRICMTQKDGQGNSIDAAQQIVGHRHSAQDPNCLFRIHRDAETIEIALSNAFSSSTASLKNVRIELLSMPSEDESSTIPLCSVGIIAAEATQLSSAVSEMVKHYDHYRTSAEKFAKHWFAVHNPRRTVAHLIANH